MTTQRAFERIGYPVVWTLAGIGIVAAMSRYLLPHDLHLAMTKVLYGPYATEQLPVLASHPVTEFIHRFGGFLYMTLGPLQFMPRIRARHLNFHRWAGRFLVALSLVGGASALLMVTRYPYAGVRESIPTYFFGIIFLYSTIKAFLHVRRGDVTLHREWMIRSVAIGLGVSTIRVVYLLCLYATDWSAQESLITSFWLGWSISLLVGECWINYTRPERQLSLVAAAEAD
jgi:uncharacterized membrane protein